MGSNQLSNSKKCKIKLLQDLTKDSYSVYYFDNNFCVFKSINAILYLIYPNIKNSIISFDLVNNKKIIEIKKAHEDYIMNFRHYLDSINRRDLIISISSRDRNIKIWDANNWMLLINIKVYNEGYLDSAYLLKDNNNNYIITCHENIRKEFCDSIKVLNFNKEEIKEIKDSNIKAFFIDAYYDINLNKIYIITGNLGCVMSYDYYNNTVYHKYLDDNNEYHNSVLINSNGDIIKMIDSCVDGFVRIWSFHSGELLNKVKISDDMLKGICMWHDFLFVACKQIITIVNLKQENIVNRIKAHQSLVLTLKIINHPSNGICLISQGESVSPIKMWKIEEE